ncbi:sugar transferase [bacterium]|nr:sugar transferase [bacterium]
MGIIILSPIFLLIAIAIKLDSKGPIIYKSKRVGTT